MGFQIHALSKAPFEEVFALSDAELSARNMVRVIAQNRPGYPCRVSLQDAEVGEALVLLNYQHLEGDTPYAAAHAIYVRQDAKRAEIAPGDVPDVLAQRVLSVRGFDRNKMMRDADVVAGCDLAAALERMFADAQVEVIHIHNAKQGCFAARATRVRV